MTKKELLMLQQQLNAKVRTKEQIVIEYLFKECNINYWGAPHWFNVDAIFDDIAYNNPDLIVCEIEEENPEELEEPVLDYEPLKLSQPVSPSEHLLPPNKNLPSRKK